MKKYIFHILLIVFLAIVGCDSNSEEGPTSPVNSVLPLIIGDPVENETLTSTAGAWAGTDLTYSYQWLANDISINGATASSYTLTAVEVGKTIKLRVTATNPHGAAEATSLPTEVVTADAASVFLSCQLSTIVSSGPYSRTETYMYDGDGKKTEWTLIQTGDFPFTISEEYEYSGQKLVKITRETGTTRELVYDADQILLVKNKDSDGDLYSTEYYEWTGSVLTVTTENVSEVILNSVEYTFNDQNIMKEVYTEFNNGELYFKRVADYSEFDELFNPEYSISYPFPISSLYNYNHIDITDTDYSGDTPVVSSFTYEYDVTSNGSNAVKNRTRTKSDNGEVLVRVYTYENCD